MACILIADWDEEDRVHLWTILEEAGHELLFARDGAQAKEIWAKNPVELIITELLMPELSGLRLIKELTEENPRVRIIALSLENADQLDLAEDYGATRTLFKPVTPEALLDAVQEVLKGYRARKDQWQDR
jgi:two-component system response regulator (stage 0 sporulation protein F)